MDNKFGIQKYGDNDDLKVSWSRIHFVSETAKSKSHELKVSECLSMLIYPFYQHSPDGATICC